MGMIVIGIGTRTGTDDQVGLILVEQVLSEKCFPEVSFALFEGVDPAITASNLIDIDHDVMLVDAADMGIEPGEFRVFDEKDAILRLKNGSVSTHGMGFAEGLALARELGFSHSLKIFAIQPFDLSPGLSLTEEMSARLPVLKTNLECELG